jgi:putative addiction module component (TIGR02574 family)
MCYVAKVTHEALLGEVLALPEDQRAALVNSLQETLASRPSPDVEAAWAQEIARRVEDVRAGSAQLIPADQALAEIRESLRARRG